MRLNATLTTAELQSLARSLLPLRVDLRRDPDDDPRWLDVQEVLEAKMISHVGFSVSARAAIRWPERALFDEFRVERAELRIEPRLDSTDGRVALVLGFEVGALDMAWVPNFVSGAVVDAINARLDDTNMELRWNFGSTLSAQFDEVGTHTNIQCVRLDMRSASLRIDAESIRLEAPLNVEVRTIPPEQMAQRAR